MQKNSLSKKRSSGIRYTEKVSGFLKKINLIYEKDYIRNTTSRMPASTQASTLDDRSWKQLKDSQPEGIVDDRDLSNGLLVPESLVDKKFFENLVRNSIQSEVAGSRSRLSSKSLEDCHHNLNLDQIKESRW